MHLTPRETDRLLLFLAAELARRRRDRGLRLNYPEARALLADAVVEGARDGRSVADLMAYGGSILTEDDVLPGVRELVGSLQVEAVFDDGQKLVTVHDPIRPGRPDGPGARDGDFQPGRIVTVDADIELSAGRETTTVTVVNTGDRPVQVGSHFHFFEVNRALRFDRAAAYGFHLDVPAGTAVRFEAGDERDVDLVAFGGTADIQGLNGMTRQVARPGEGQDAAVAARAAGFLDSRSDVR